MCKDKDPVQQKKKKKKKKKERKEKTENLKIVVQIPKFRYLVLVQIPKKHA